MGAPTATGARGCRTMMDARDLSPTGPWVASSPSDHAAISREMSTAHPRAFLADLVRHRLRTIRRTAALFQPGRRSITVFVFEPP